LLRGKKNEKLEKLILKGMFYEEVETFTVNELLKNLLDAKLKHNFASFFRDFDFSKSYHILYRKIEE
jgi:hypothetical protein